MTITLRSQSATGATTKGSTLTHAELDNNFIDILQNKVQAIDVRGDTGTQLVGTSLSNEILQVVGGTGISTAVTSDSAGQAKITITASATGDVTGAASSTDNAITRFDSTTGKLIQNSLVTVADDGAITAPQVGSVIPFYFANQAAFPSAATYHGAIAHSHSDGKMYFAHGSAWNALANASDAIELSTDTTPQLGGDLDMNGQKIVTTSNANIVLQPNGTGDVELNADTIKIGDTNVNATITTNGTGDLILNTNSGSSSGVITILDGLDGDITLVPSGTGKVHAETSEFRIGINNTNTKMTTKGTGDLTLDTNSGTNSGSIVIFDGINGNIEITPNGTGQVKLDYSLWPVTDGSSGQFLSTNGSGVLSWSTGSTFAPASPGEIGATTPDVGNFTDLKVKAASSVVKELQLHDQDNSNYVGFKAPTTVSANKVWVLPSADGTANQVLTTNGSGTLSFSTVSSSTVTVSDDTTTNATRYIVFEDVTTGTSTSINVASTKLTFNPSTGTLTATAFAGSLSGATGLPVSGITSSTSTALGVGSLELGHATDTTISRVSAGRIAVEGVNVVTISSTDTLTNKTLTTPIISSISNTGTITIPTTTGTLGYQNLPAVGTKTTSYTLATGDVGKYVQVGSGGSITIPNSTFAEGDVIVVVNNHSAAITITCTITDAYIGGTDTDKATVSLATRGVCNILFLSATRCIITGNVS